MIIVIASIYFNFGVFPVCFLTKATSYNLWMVDISSVMLLGIFVAILKIFFCTTTKCFYMCFITYSQDTFIHPSLVFSLLPVLLFSFSGFGFGFGFIRWQMKGIIGIGVEEN